MTTNEFIDYIEALMENKHVFYAKSTDDQNARNARRQPAKRWNETKVERAVDKQWKEFMTNIYNQVLFKVAKTTPPEKGWIDFFNESDFVNSLDESIHEIEFD